MTEQRFQRLRLGLTVLATFAELAHLAWEHLDGGVVSHHFLDRSDLPSVSNGWGALLVPALTWMLLGRIRKRVVDRSERTPGIPLAVVSGFVVAMLFGLAISISFTSGHDAIASFVFPCMVVLAVLLPGYRAECVLGFVLAMTYTFGAVLPTFIATVLAAASAIVHLGVRPLLARLWASLRRPRSTAT